MDSEQQNMKIVVTADTGQAEEKMSGFSGSLQRIGEVAAGIGLERLAEKFISLGESVVTGSVKSFEESQNVMAQFDAVFKSTGGAIGMTKEQLIGLSKELENTTTFSDESALSAETLLLQFNKVGKDIFPETIKQASNLATRMHLDLPQASKLLGRALEDPAKGMNTLSRLGVKFSDDQKKVVAAMVKTGDTAGAQKYILEQLNKVMGGAASADAATFAGQLKHMNEVIDDIKEVIGGAIVKGITPFLEALKPVLNLVRDVAEGHKSWDEVVKGLQAKFPQFAGVIELAKTAITFLINEIKSFAIPIMAQLQEIWQKHHAAISLIAGVIGGILYGAIVAIIAIIGAFILGLSKVIEIAFTVGENIVKLFGHLNDLKAIFNDVSNNIKTGIGNTIQWLHDKISDAIKAVKDFISNLNPLKNFKLNVSIPGFGGQPGKQSGGFASGLTVVGESGPEMVSLPSGSYVHSPAESKKMSTTFSPTIHINNPQVRSNNDIREIVSQVKHALGRQNELAKLGAI